MKLKRGFTLIELLVVVVIVALILLVAVPSFRSSRLAGNNRIATAQLSALGNAARMYAVDKIGGVPVPIVATQVNLQVGDLVEAADTNCPTTAPGVIAANVKHLFDCGYVKPFRIDTGASTASNAAAVYSTYIFWFCPTTGGAPCCTAAAGAPQRIVAMSFNGASGTANRYSATDACAWIDVEGKLSNNYVVDRPI